MSGRELARHDRHSAGGAYWAIDGEIREVHALASHFIQMRGLAKSTAMNSQISVTPIIGEDENNVGFRRFICRILR